MSGSESVTTELVERISILLTASFNGSIPPISYLTFMPVDISSSLAGSFLTPQVFHKEEIDLLLLAPTSALTAESESFLLRQRSIHGESQSYEVNPTVKRYRESIRMHFNALVDSKNYYSLPWNRYGQNGSRLSNRLN